MKIVPALLLGVFLTIWACKKEEPVKEPDPVQPVVQTGELKIKVTAHDGMGDVMADHSGVKVTLQNGATANTNTLGEVSFPGLTYGAYAPSLLKSGSEGPPVAIQLQNPSQQSELPIAEHSKYEVTQLQCQVISKASINLYFNVEMPIPSGKPLKVAILTHSVAPTAGTFSSVDIITVETQSVSAMNIANLPDLNATVNKLANGAVFYVSAIPVSYGLYNSNLTVKPSLLGESLSAHASIQLIKNW